MKINFSIVFNSYPEMEKYLNNLNKEEKSNFWWSVKYDNGYKFVLKSFN